jgi:hypothetical protein
MGERRTTKVKWGVDEPWLILLACSQTHLRVLIDETRRDSHTPLGDSQDCGTVHTAQLSLVVNARGRSHTVNDHYTHVRVSPCVRSAHWT